MATPLSMSKSISGSAVAGSRSSDLMAVVAKFQNLSTTSGAGTRKVTQMSRVCDMTGKKANNAMAISFSHKRHKKLQQPNLKMKRFYWEEGNRWVQMKLSTKAIKTITLKGIDRVAKDNGVDLTEYSI
eukprot:jgi/Mesvir1/24897/Mv22119-RA.1